MPNVWSVKQTQSFFNVKNPTWFDEIFLIPDTLESIGKYNMCAGRLICGTSALEGVSCQNCYFLGDQYRSASGSAFALVLTEKLIIANSFAAPSALMLTSKKSEKHFSLMNV